MRHTSKCLVAAVVMVVVSAVALAPASDATTRIRGLRASIAAVSLYPLRYGAQGFVDRNDDCPAAYACEDIAVLRRSNWYGMDNVSGTARSFSSSTGVACGQGTRDFQARHTARYLGDSSISLGITVGGGGVSVGWGGPGWSRWFTNDSAKSRFSTSC
jgi:hypothetical protein